MKKLSVLIVEDDPLLLRSLQRTLAGAAQVDLRFAPGANEALALARQDPPHLVVADYRMPEVDGLELLSRMRSEYPQVRCVLFTAEPPLNIGALHDITVILKPCGFEEFNAIFDSASTALGLAEMA
jgi:CheY-like chemotaxis protein